MVNFCFFGGPSGATLFFDPKSFFFDPTFFFDPKSFFLTLLPFFLTLRPFFWPYYPLSWPSQEKLKKKEYLLVITFQVPARLHCNPDHFRILLYCHTLKNIWWLQSSKFTRCLQSSCIAIHFKITGGVNDLKISPCCPAIISIHGQITGAFNNWNFPLLPAILLYFQTLPTHWWLQLLKFPLLPAILLSSQTMQNIWWRQ